MHTRNFCNSCGWRSCLLVAGVLVLFALVLQADSESTSVRKPTDQEIVKGAAETSSSWRGSGGEIPRRHWSHAICELNPIRVYRHRVNIVVVQKKENGVERGFYIYIPVSSYLPEDGLDGFKLNPSPLKDGVYRLGTGVFKYERKGD